MNRKNRTTGKTGANKGRGDKRKTGKSDKHPFQKFVKDKPDREKTRREKPAFSREGRDDRRNSGSDFKKEERPKYASRRSAGESKEGSRERSPSSRGEGFRSKRPFHSEYPKRENRSDKRFGEKPYRSQEERNRENEESSEKTSKRRFKPSREESKEKRGFGEKSFRSERRSGNRGENSEKRFSKEKPFRDKAKKDKGEYSEKRFKHDDFEEGRGFKKREDQSHQNKRGKTHSKSDDGSIRLNKYLSHAGVASRRDADDLIISGAVKVNGVVVNQLGAKIKPGDKVTYGDQAVQGERKVYLLLNKPKDYITTMDDPRDRKTVMNLVEGACRERVYPVGRLDRNTTGLLLLTNDGELAAKLTHPKYGVKKVYHASINKGLKPEHFQQLTEGVELEDGIVKVDDIAFVGEGKKEIGLELHSGKNRVVRRLFEHLGYDVIKLDRVVFAGLTKKDLPRGKYRFLSPKEVSFLKMIG